MSLAAGYRRKAAAGRRGIVLISGEAGVRKSSLLRQFELNVDGGRAIFASARCVEFIQTPLGPLRELLKQVDRNSSLARDAGTRALLERLSFERGAKGRPRNRRAGCWNPLMRRLRGTCSGASSSFS